jgi:hypothetical protein
VLVKAKLYRSIGPATTDENWLSHFNHPLLPTSTTVAAPPDSVVTDQDNNISSIEIVWDRIDEGTVSLLAEFIELCVSDPFPYKAGETVGHIGHNLWPTLVHEVHQNRLAQSITNLFEFTRGAEVLPSVVNLPIFEAYVDESVMKSWGPCPPWLTSSEARNTIKATFSSYAETLFNGTLSDSESVFLLPRLQQIIERIDSLHSDIKLDLSTSGKFAPYFLRSNAELIIPDVEEIKDEDSGGSS